MLDLSGEAVDAERTLWGRDPPVWVEVELGVDLFRRRVRWARPRAVVRERWRPFRRRYGRQFACRLTRGSCVENRKVTPFSRLRRCIRSMICSLVVESRFAVGLVGEDKLGVCDERLGDGHALALAAGKLVGPMLARRAEPHFVDELPHAQAELAERLSLLPHQAWELDVLDHIEHGDEIE